MSELNEIDINSLHATVLRELESDVIQEIDPNFYRNLSDFTNHCFGHLLFGCKEIQRTNYRITFGRRTSSRCR